MIEPDFNTFRAMAQRATLIPMRRRLLSDQLSPVLAYRRLVAADDRTAPSFLFESVEGGEQIGRYSILGAQPDVEIIAREHDVITIDHRNDSTTSAHEDDPLRVPRQLTKEWRLPPASMIERLRLPGAFPGGWVGYAGYDTVRYLERNKLPFADAPRDDRTLPDMHFGLYRLVVVFDHVDKIVHAINHVPVPAIDSIDAAYDAGCAELEELVARLQVHSVPLPVGEINLDLSQAPPVPDGANFTRDEFEDAVMRAKEYIRAGDAFQIVLSQRFERETTADPFDIYRALRVVNPSPYMIYLQASGSIMVASSPEILCRVRDRVVTNRPLAGTRRRGAVAEDDRALEIELLADEKECAEHIMLVDLARNDVGTVCDVGSIRLPSIMSIERYSHVMHISSTVTGELREGCDCWDALRAALPVGTVSGAPKVRAMQIIDELEPTRRGPYGGGIGGVSFDGDMDIALTLRTMIIPTHTPESVDIKGAIARDDARSRDADPERIDAASACSEDADREPGEDASGIPQQWTVHLQAGAGIVADSVPAREYEETVNKAAALGRAIDLAEAAFGPLQRAYP